MTLRVPRTHLSIDPTSHAYDTVRERVLRFCKQVVISWQSCTSRSGVTRSDDPRAVQKGSEHSIDMIEFKGLPLHDTARMPFSSQYVKRIACQGRRSLRYASNLQRPNARSFLSTGFAGGTKRTGNCAIRQTMPSLSTTHCKVQ